MDSDLRTALPAGGFYWQVVMPAGTPGMSPVLLQLSVQWGLVQEMLNGVFFLNFGTWFVCEFLLFWFCCVVFFFLEGVWGCFVCNTCSLYVTALQPAGLQVLGWFVFPVLPFGCSVGDTSGSPCRHFINESCKHHPF